MDGLIMEIQQAMGTQKNRLAGSKYLHAFVEEMKKSGFARGKEIKPARRRGRTTGE